MVSHYEYPDDQSITHGRRRRGANEWQGFHIGTLSDLPQTDLYSRVGRCFDVWMVLQSLRVTLLAFNEHECGGCVYGATSLLQ